MAAAAPAIDINVANNAELRANAQDVLAFTRAARPKSTTLAYEPKQTEFKVSWLSWLYNWKPAGRPAS